VIAPVIYIRFSLVMEHGSNWPYKKKNNNNNVAGSIAKHSAANNTYTAPEQYSVLHCVETVNQQISKKHK